ncbi:2-amino-4-hydroxy-6-hydroxymethyldihydropteridine diphosphokinase [Natranaerovirga hydrolytica]|uniref:2-amino-4-hydroxy-6-hydroxymethyldihydropteridine diphosphokinase n=1 Tax=Natranaerovirga hydrolytica TaxID=680378 RepID=A0A4R1ML42_9FIRM|nr:2-amino-4-hydroxy-6-hydroxymethyldihydropteridine diphosphokinase [Natranaerovirga hydrolytica]TCK93307.1 2-amino-4-hydroxy-6-hydroxymethyldihydropteridine diphosphokinase [Natranaerovirga hydrolytica]
MTKAYLGLGSNMGDKKNNLKKAIEQLSNHSAIKICNISSLYETEPVGYTNQDDFYNLVIEIQTSLEPYDLLAYVNEVENNLKRKRDIRWGPRTMDIDILLYNGYSSTDEKLTVPHPRMTERAFVIVPLYELNSNLVIQGTPIEDIYNTINKESIKKIEDTLCDA